MYHRPKAQAGNTSRLSDFVMEEQLENDVVYDEHDSQFELEVDRLVPGYYGLRYQRSIPFAACGSCSVFYKVQQKFDQINAYEHGRLSFAQKT